MGTASVDVGTLRAIAREYQAAATLVEDAARNRLSHLAFGGASAGRAYVEHGEGLRRALEEVVASLRQWSRAAAEIASALRVSADRYVDADARAADRVG